MSVLYPTPEERAERSNRESIIRSTIEHNPHHGLEAREVERAVEHGMAISDGEGRQSWRDISDSAIAVTKADRGRS